MGASSSLLGRADASSGLSARGHCLGGHSEPVSPRFITEVIKSVGCVNSIGPNSGSAFLCMRFSEDESKTWQMAELRGNRESFRSLGIGPTALEEMKVIY